MTERRETSWRIGRTINVETIVAVLVFFLGGIALWYHQDQRIAAIEQIETQRAEALKQLTPALQKVNQNFDLLNQRLHDFPLHRHMKDHTGTIVYPNGVSFPAEDKPDSYNAPRHFNAPIESAITAEPAPGRPNKGEHRQ